jgi:RNA recognition motif-containing protein
MEICVENLPSDVTGNDLREVFELFGRVETADVVKHGYDNECRGLGFVDMPSRSEAASAVFGLHGRNWDGQAITATEVRPRDPVSGACCPRCDCRSRKQATENTQRISAESRRQGGDNSAGENGSE